MVLNRWSELPSAINDILDVAKMKAEGCVIVDVKRKRIFVTVVLKRKNKFTALEFQRIGDRFVSMGAGTPGWVGTPGDAIAAVVRP